MKRRRHSYSDSDLSCPIHVGTCRCIHRCSLEHSNAFIDVHVRKQHHRNISMHSLLFLVTCSSCSQSHDLSFHWWARVHKSGGGLAGAGKNVSSIPVNRYARVSRADQPGACFLCARFLSVLWRHSQSRRKQAPAFRKPAFSVSAPLGYMQPVTHLALP